MKKVLLTTVAFALLFGFVTNAKADFVFNLSGWKDNNAVGKIEDMIGMSVKDAFQFTFSQNGNGAKLTFDLSPYVYQNHLEDIVGGGDKGLKFKDFFFKDDLDSIFSFKNLSWSNGGWTSTSNTSTSVLLDFANGYTWEDFEKLVNSEDFNGYIEAHLQSIGKGGQSINEGKFTVTREPDQGASGGTTPEPATLLIIGLGTIGAGFAARRRMSK